MTTIATDGKTVAADGRETRGWEITNNNAVKLRVGRNPHGGRAIYACTGEFSVFEAAIEWAQNGARPGDVPKADEDWSLIVVDTVAGVISYDSKSPFPSRHNVPCAFGNGRDFARAAMMCGKTPAEAVEIAIQCDASSGGTIMVLDIAESLEFVQKIAAE